MLSDIFSEYINNGNTHDSLSINKFIRPWFVTYNSNSNL